MRCLLSLALLISSLVPAAEPPNFIVINIDDLGYADIGPFGSKLNRTPNLDRMAQEGRKLTSFYAAPVCSPSRSALMTGCYPKRVLPIPHVLFPISTTGLHPDEVTVAEVLKGAGYATGCIGKWHLGDQPEFLPTRQGFDYFLGLPYSNDMGTAAEGAKSDLGQPLPKPREGPGQPPLPLLENETVIARVKQDEQQGIVERYTTAAVKFIRERKDKPFFLYLPHNAVHFPLYPGKAWAGKSPHGLYSDWVEEVDWSVGQVLDTLRELKLDQRTLVIFTSDNGGTPRGMNTPLHGHKGSTWEGGMRVPTVAWYPGHIPAGTHTDAISGMFDVLPTFAALAGAKLPDHKLDGVNLWPHLTGDGTEKPAHESFLYYAGLTLNAVRDGDWKLHFVTKGKPAKKAAPKGRLQLYNVKDDIGETHDVSAQHPDIVAKLTALADSTQNDLGRDGLAPGTRALGKVEQALPLIDHDGKIRAGFEPK
jgi:arylsulfatase A